MAKRVDAVAFVLLLSRPCLKSSGGFLSIASKAIRCVVLESFQPTSAIRQGSRFHRVLVGVFVLSLSGCSTLVTAPQPQDKSALPLLTSRKLSEDSVILEVGFVHVPQHDEEWSRKLWSE